jgi:rhamnosyl/mannosyltransferase
MAAPRKLKVLQVGKFYSPYRGGIESHLETLSKALRECVDLKVVVSNCQGVTTNEEVEGVPVTRLAARMSAGTSVIAPSLIQAIGKSDADIIHIHLPNPWAVAAYLVSGSRKPLVVTHHSDIVRQRILGLLYAPVQEIMMRRCAAVIVSSPNVIEHSSVLRRYRSKCRVVPFGLPADAFEEPSLGSVARIREEYGQPLILSVGRLVYYKGGEYLIRAMKRITGKLVIVGKGPLESSLKELIRTEGLGERVVLLQDVSSENLKALYHAADVFALPSVAKSEAFGIVQIEAMAAGCPVVNTDLPSGVPFVSKHGESGLTVPPRDSGALADAINRLLSDAALRRRYAEGAKARATRLFTAGQMIDGTLDVYRTVSSPAGDFAPITGRYVSAGLTCND